MGAAIVGINGEPIGEPEAPQLKESPISPKMNAELKKLQQEFGQAQAAASQLGLQASVLLREAGRAVTEMEKTEMELRKVMEKAAKTSGIQKEQIRGFDTERGMALYE